MPGLFLHSQKKKRCKAVTGAIA